MGPSMDHGLEMGVDLSLIHACRGLKRPPKGLKRSLKGLNRPLKAQPNEAVGQFLMGCCL